jgi:hypothetical protein
MAYIKDGTKNMEEKNLSESGLPELKTTPCTGSNLNSATPRPESATLGPLSRDLSIHLLGLAKKVTETEITPATVNAACQCAAELYKIMKLNWEMKGR